MQEIFENPLLLTMFLWIVEDSGMKLPLDIRDTVAFMKAHWFMDKKRIR